MHGGGYVGGSAKEYLGHVQSVAEALDCVIVTVEYRLAPETAYPGSLEDNYAALRWTYAHADEIGLDRARLAIMGESAGGGHAAALAVAARDRGEIPIVLQVLIYPMIDDRTGTTAPVPAHIGSLVWTTESNRIGWTALLGHAPGGAHTPPEAAVARLADLSGLPPTFIAVGGLDLFVEEDLVYATRLINAGVPTELYVAPGAFHAFDLVAPDAAVSKAFTGATLGALRRAFGQ
jgi:acetyl esterase/lipase